ncbi:Serine/threonine-protein kinase PrkC [Polystyrenella longa]|uniref:Serine/threonine-protein kinase PrkC n=1 Tax=Polystyrenella longa TaxID=2528007 RepID=A0A518CNT2_9PLAN|nr:serine/threonine-protein kinase [Polystyrenella longa]QDU80879.1 Serine/threonine-protein kinase PrkC [Polystyrenella longa]
MTESGADKSNTSESSSDEDQLSLLLEQLMENPSESKLSQLTSAHPEFSDDLKELWATLKIVDFAQLELNDPTPVPPSFASSQDYFLDRPTEKASADNPQSGAVPSEDRPVVNRVGNYELLEEIGRGGMGVVYKARQAGINRTVALKMISQGALASLEERSRFQIEAETAGQLHHPNIVPVYEVGEIHGHPYFTMQMIEGTNLAERLYKGPLSNRDAVALLVSIAGALAEAHQRGILHRDLKPSNILIDQHGCPYVSDFGLACRYEMTAGGTSSEVTELEPGPTRLTMTGAVLGTPGYLAPEQAAGNRKSLDETTDVYGLGAVLYAMLTGVAPFQGANSLEVLMRVLEQEPVQPRLLNPEIDRDLELILLKCLQKPQELRYQSARELEADLKAYLNDEPIAARTSHFSQIWLRMFRETHHAPVLENWGLLWMWHSLVLLLICVITNVLQYFDFETRLPYLSIWCVGLWVWSGIFWSARRRSGPVTFVERQIAHVWTGSLIASMLLFWLEYAMDLPVLSLSPVLGFISGCVFLVKAGILTGAFYIQSAALFVTGVLMQLISMHSPFDFSISLFGVVAAVSFWVPGWYYFRQSRA